MTPPATVVALGTLTVVDSHFTNTRLDDNEKSEDNDDSASDTEDDNIEEEYILGF